MKWEELRIEEVPFENLKVVLGALLKHLNLTLEERRWHDGGHDYRVLPSIIEE